MNVIGEGTRPISSSDWFVQQAVRIDGGGEGVRVRVKMDTYDGGLPVDAPDASERTSDLKHVVVVHKDGFCNEEGWEVKEIVADEQAMELVQRYLDKNFGIKISEDQWLKHLTAANL